MSWSDRSSICWDFKLSEGELSTGDEVPEFRMFYDEGRNKRALGNDFEALRAGEFERAAGESRAHAVAFDSLGHFGMRESSNSTGRAIQDEGRSAIGYKFITVHGGIVRHRIRHRLSPVCTNPPYAIGTIK